ncbi:MAG TPA: hypothetical protein VF620_05380 [Allosphingosinicella sp.]|jgi:hypothetical protein
MNKPALVALAAFLAAAAPAQAAPARAPAPTNAWKCAPADMPELCRLADDDQKDRTAEPIDWARTQPRDARRREAVLALLRASTPKTSGDYFHAALVMQHGETWEDFAAAHLLATRALQLSPADPNVQRMVAASWDRMMHSMGKKQWFGTNTFTTNGVAEAKETRPDRVPQSLIDLWSRPWVFPQ